jgi:prevent-host-death family protein
LNNSKVNADEGPSMETIPCSELRAHLAETIKQLEVRDEPVFIARCGEPVAVLMSVAQHHRIAGGQKTGFAAALESWRQRYQAELEEEDRSGAYVDPFADVRDRAPPRAATWAHGIFPGDGK